MENLCIYDIYLYVNYFHVLKVYVYIYIYTIHTYIYLYLCIYI